MRERPDDIIGFEPWHLKAWNAIEIDNLFYAGELWDEVIGEGRAVGFILGELFVAKRRVWAIPCNGDEVGAMLFEQPDQRAGEGEGSPGWLATLRGEGSGDKSEVSSEEDGHTIEEKESFRFGHEV